MLDLLASVVVDGVFFGSWPVPRILFVLLGLTCIATISLLFFHF